MVKVKHSEDSKMTILTSQLTKLTVRALRELQDSITKKGKAAPKNSPKRQELRDDYLKVKRAIDKKEQYGKNVSAADKVLDNKKATPDVDQDDIPVIERASRAEKGRPSNIYPVVEGGEPLTREGQAAASKFKSWLTSQIPPKMNELGSIYYRGKEAVEVSEKLIKEIKNTTDPKKLSALNKRLDRSNKKAQKLRVKYKEVKDRGTRMGGGQKDESMQARISKERRVKLEDIEPLATGRKGREQLGKRQLIKDADRKKLATQVKKFMNRSGKVTKVPTGKQVTAGAPDDSEGIKDLLNNIQAALATASKVPANPDRKSVRAQKKFNEATVGQITSNLRSGGLSALQKIIREEKKKSPRTWKNAVANLKNASVAVQKQAARLGIINKSAIKTPPKKTKPYKPKKPEVRKGKPRVVNGKTVETTQYRKKGGKVLKAKPKRKVTTVKAVKPKRKVTTVKRKTTAPRKRAALRGYGKALRGF